MLKWFRQRKINRLLVKRAGYKAYVEQDSKSLIGVSYERARLAECEEELRQLGWKERDQ